MNKRVVALGAGIVMALSIAAPASADHQAGPCTPSEDPGHSEYAQHHIVVLAEAGALGNGGHIPGDHHGFGGCAPTENLP
jgi:hypothetical protein